MLKCPSIGGWQNCPWCTHTQYTASKKQLNATWDPGLGCKIKKDMNGKTVKSK